MDRRQKSEAGETGSLSKLRLKRPRNRVVHPRAQSGSEALKEKYLQCFSTRTSTMAALRKIVKELVWAGVSRAMMVKWATEAGYSKPYASSLLSRLLCSVGMRARGVGAGRKPSSDGLRLLDYARSQFGDKCLNVLRAAWRAGKAELATHDPRSEGTPITVPQLDGYNSNLKRRLKKVALNGKHFSASVKER